MLGLDSPNSLLQSMKRWRVLKLSHITPSPVVLGALTSKQSTAQPNGRDKRKIYPESRGSISNVPFKVLENIIYTSGTKRTENSLVFLLTTWSRQGVFEEGANPVLYNNGCVRQPSKEQ